MVVKSDNVVTCLLCMWHLKAVYSSKKLLWTRACFFRYKIQVFKSLFWNKTFLVFKVPCSLQTSNRNTPHMPGITNHFCSQRERERESFSQFFQIFKRYCFPESGAALFRGSFLISLGQETLGSPIGISCPLRLVCL